MERIQASQGIEWIRQGFALFRQQPAELSMLFLLYMLLMFSLSLIPLLGQLLPLLLVPVFSQVMAPLTVTPAGKVSVMTVPVPFNGLVPLRLRESESPGPLLTTSTTQLKG